MIDLRHYITSIQSDDDLLIIKKRVNTKYEIAAITAKLDNSKAILFENVGKKKFSVITNLLGTKNRFAKALMTKPSDIYNKLNHVTNHSQKPKLVIKGKFEENTSTDLSILPIITHFKKEPGPFITSSMIHVKNAKHTTQNASFHRLMYIDNRHLSIRLVEGRHLHKAFMHSKNQDSDLKIAVTIGVHPAVSIAGAYQYDYGKNELNIANSILHNKLELSLCPYTGLYVPAHSEIVLEGVLLKNKTHKEWMVEMLRTYDFIRDQPVFELKRLYYRNNPIFHDILSGYSEHRLLMGMPIESKLNIEIKKIFKHVTGIKLTNGGCNWLHAVAQISMKNKINPKTIIKKIFSIHKSLKLIIIVDDDIDIDNPNSIEYALATRFQADNDLLLIKNERGSSLDPSSDQKNLRTSKLGINATKSKYKRQDGFEIAKIPNYDNIVLRNYFEHNNS